MIPAWVAPYTELAWDAREMNCWTLARRVLRERFGLEVPAYDDGATIDACDADRVGTLIAGHSVEWREVAVPHPGDLVLFRVYRLPQHLGVVVDPPWFLHIEREANSTVCRWTAAPWTYRLIGFYRHPELAECPA